jgi:50S ribosomal subunit-associated GTPase HflX
VHGLADVRTLADCHDVRVRWYGTGPGAAAGLTGADVAIIGLFSGKDKAYGAKLDQLAASVEALGGRVVSRHVQRRGVSHGGAAKMADPFSRRTLLSPGKAREVGQACRDRGVDVAVFVNSLTDLQRSALADIFGCLVVTGDDLATSGR